jgi:hypothetical protein
MRHPLPHHPRNPGGSIIGEKVDMEPSSCKTVPPAPLSSACTLTLDAAAAMSCLPTAVDPVNPILRTVSFPVISLPAGRAHSN